MSWTKELLTWFTAHRRPLAWREPGTSAWGVLLSEVMSQQTPVARVEPIWRDWLARWPTPRDFAAAERAEILRAWSTLGYPRRALRLHECAQQIVSLHDGHVPSTVNDLLALPGIGDYTARAVACFHFGANVPVVDTNVRRVYHRFQLGEANGGNASKRELAQVAALLPEDGRGPEISVALMELGALVCRATRPDCANCPLLKHCAWIAAGQPPQQQRRRGQKFAGTDRQVRGKIMAVLRASESPVEIAIIQEVWQEQEQLRRCLSSLIDDGLAEQDAAGRVRLPS